jgi:glutamyl-tRNA reductase
MSTHSREGPERNTVPLAVVGCDFRVASTQWRNQLLLGDAERCQLADALRTACGAEGLVVVETCNRVEWVAVAPATGWTVEVLRAQMVDQWRRAGLIGGGDETAGVAKTPPQPYGFTGDSAVRHLLRVAVGLESFVQGEREVAGQLNRALDRARAESSAATLHNALQSALGRTVRKVQRLTAWRQAARGVHGLCFEALERELPARPGRVRSVAVVGQGEIGRKVVALLTGTKSWRVHKFNRTVHGREVLPLAQVREMLPRLDALVVATGARQVVLDLQVHHRPNPLVVVDLGAPPQVTLADAAGAKLISLDDLLHTPTNDTAPADRAAVEALVEDGVREFLIEHRKRELADLLRAVHDAHGRAAHVRLPQVLANALPEVEPDRRRRVELALAEVLREHTRGVVHAIEAAARADAVEVQ